MPKIALTAFGRPMRPLPNGHRPASTRKSVVLPLPEGPRTRRDSPWRMVTSTSFSSTAPPGSRTSTSLKVSSGVCCTLVAKAVAAAAFLALTMASLKVVSRSTPAFHSASFW